MDKEEAIKILKDFHDKSALFSVRTALETLHPELTESEDEKTRKEIIYHIKNCDDTIDEETEKRMLAWLENQGEQNPAEWSEKDESLRLRTIGALETCKIGSPTKCVDEQINWLKSLKQRYTWKPSDEQLEFLQKCIEAYNGVTFPTEVRVLSSLYNDLKKLREG